LKNCKQIKRDRALLDIKIKSKHQVLTEEKLDETDAGLEHSPWESLRHLAYETRV